MPETPFLVLVDPRAQRRAAIRQRLASIALGAAVGLLSAVPFALQLMR